MIKKEDVLRQLAQAIPEQRLKQMVDVAHKSMQSKPGFSIEDLDMLIQTLAAMMDMPDKYPQMRRDLIAQGVVDESDLPPQFSSEAIGLMLLISLKMKHDMQAQAVPAMARGGLNQLSQYGRGADSIVAHISPREARILGHTRKKKKKKKKYGFWGDLFKVVAPLALSIFAPGIGTAIGAGLGASAAWAPIVGNAVVGAGTSALTGGDPLKGAISGGISGGLGSMLGEGITSATGFDMSPATQNVVGSSLASGLGSLATGDKFTEGAVQGGLGAMAQNTFSSKPESTDQGKPESTELTEPTSQGKPASTEAKSSSSKDTSFGLNLKTIGSALPVLSFFMKSNAPDDAKQSVSNMTEQQQEYFNRPGITWDWDMMRADAAKNGMSLGQYMSRNWGDITRQGRYNTVKPMATGGLSQVSRLMRGSGNGRSDTINARLSDGEYVIDAESVALLGDGSTKAGAQRLDEMRKHLRQHKGKMLSKGKFSPQAKTPLVYLKEIS